MLRAIETALYSFKGKEIFPIPWVAESSTDGMWTENNLPTSWSKQKEYINSHDETPYGTPGGVASERVMYGNKGGIDPPDAQQLRDGRFFSDYDDFLQSFPALLTVSSITSTLY